MAITPVHLSNKTTFSEIEARFSMEVGGKDQHIQTKEGKELYTSDKKASLATVKALFGFGQQIGIRAAKRDAGTFEIRQSLDREFGIGVGDRVFKHLQDKGTDLTHGVKRSDLGAIRNAFKDLQIQAAVAHKDESHGLGSGSQPLPANTATFAAYVGRHFDVLSSPDFFVYYKAKMASDFFGSTLAMNVIDRIVAKGGVEPKDLVDLQRTLGPYVGPDVTPAPAVPGHLVGRLTDDTLKELTGIVFQRYLANGADIPLNVEGQPTAAIAEVAFDPHSTKSGSERLDALRNVHAAGIRNGQGSEPMTEALKNMMDRSA